MVSINSITNNAGALITVNDLRQVGISPQLVAQIEALEARMRAGTPVAQPEVRAIALDLAKAILVRLGADSLGGMLGGMWGGS